MSRKATSSRAQRVTPTAKSGKTATKAKAASSRGKTSTRAAAKQEASATKRPPPVVDSPSGKVARSSGAAAPGGSTDKQLSPTEVLLRAEADVTTAIETLNAHMNTALNTFVELASVQHGRGKAVIRTAPLDRATAAFQRLVAEVVDDQLAEMLPPLADLRNEIARRANNGSPEDAANHAFYEHSSQMLDHVLSLAGARVYEARAGEPFDPLIHLAVGETRRGDLADGTVSELIQPGFRSARGKVLLPARVKVNRR